MRIGEQVDAGQSAEEMSAAFVMKRPTWSPGYVNVHVRRLTMSSTAVGHGGNEDGMMAMTMEVRMVSSWRC